MGKIGIWELLIVLVIVLLIFGPKALPKLGKSVGKTIGNFKKGLSEDDETDEDMSEYKRERGTAEKTESDDGEA